MKVTGTWAFDQAVNGPARVLVHLPDHGAHTRRATYEVETAQGTKRRVLSQPGEGNRWKSLGAFMFNGTPQVRLTSVTSDGNGTEDVAFDAIAIDPIPGTYEEHTVDAVALFDENQDIDTDPVSTWWADTPLKSRQALYDWGLTISTAVTGLPVCTSGPTAQCAPAGVRDAMQDWRNQVLAAGTDPVDHPPGESIATWIGFANPHSYRPISSIRPSHFDTDDSSYKIKSTVEISFVTGPDGLVVPGSEHVEYSHRTGNTHLPEFVMDSFGAIEADYGVAAPDLTYHIEDLNLHDGAGRTATPNQTGVLPGRAYAYGGRTPTITEGGTCVAALYVSGGTIGYRPMLGAGGPSDQVAAWADAVRNAPTVAPAVRDLAGEIYNMFFKGGVTGSTFVQAPPIWQEINVKACTGGQVGMNSGEPILRASHMPNQYLYHDGLAIDLEGGRRFSSQPILVGNFIGFTNVVDRTRPHPFGWCYYGGGGNGNPWEIAVSIPTDPGINPGVVQFCDGSTPDPEFSS